MTEAPLELRFVQNLRRLTGGDGFGHLLVAFSGGLDSTVLLHLLRFQTPPPIRVSAAHFDHRMRASSAEDAAWVRDLCAEWGVELVSGVAEQELRGESAARDVRYAFLRDVARHTGADRIVTAHHADDQAETVLFRILRGTGLHGLAGIPPRSGSGLLRPLLPFWREELNEYADRHRLRWRTDPTNATLAPTRNRIRLSIIPEIEREVSPHARRHLVALAELARESEAAWRSIIAAARREVIRHDGGALVLARDRLRRYDRPVQTRLVRHALRRFGIVPSRAGTRTALAFITDAHSGRELQLQRGVRIRIEFDDARLEWAGAHPEEDTAITIEYLGPRTPVSEHLRLGGCTFRIEVREGSGSGEDGDGGALWRARIPIPSHFPLTIRGRRSGDMVRTTGGTKSLKKLMIERRVPLQERSQRPVLVDADGAVLWVAGLDPFFRTTEAGRGTLDVAVHHD